MPILSSELTFRCSASQNTAGWQDADIDGLGEFVSQTQVSASNTLPDVTGAENLAGYTDYYCMFVLNGNATLTLYNAKVWIESQGAGGSDITVGLDPTAASARTSGSAQAIVIADPEDSTDQLSGVTFSAASTEATALAVGTLGPYQVRAIWLKRVTDNVDATTDTVTLSLKGETVS